MGREIEAFTRSVHLFFKEVIQVVFADAVNPAKLHTLQFFAADKLQYGQVVELQGIRDFFRSEEPLNHSI